MRSGVAIARISLVVRDLQVATTFYRDALGFETVAEMEARGARGQRLRLGDQHLDLLSYEIEGSPYPTPRAANDPWFQHFAIAVNDMDGAYARLCRHPHEPISLGGPQRLPPSTGSVTAYKFRDPDGHPLELSLIPGSEWTTREGGPCVGIDHTAIAVADLGASIAFYNALGFTIAGRGYNHGPEQDRLDGLDEVNLEIVSLRTQKAGPHLELLHYRSPPPAQMRPPAMLNDIVSTQLTLRADSAAGLIRDPDGRFVEVVAGSPSLLAD